MNPFGLGFSANFVHNHHAFHALGRALVTIGVDLAGVKPTDAPTVSVLWFNVEYGKIAAFREAMGEHLGGWTYHSPSMMVPGSVKLEDGPHFVECFLSAEDEHEDRYTPEAQAIQDAALEPKP